MKRNIPVAKTVLSYLFILQKGCIHVHKEILYGKKEQKKLQLSRGNAFKAFYRVEGIYEQIEVDSDLEDEP